MREGRAAPHRPAGHFSPYSDGEKDAVIEDFANYRRCRMSAKIAVSAPLPVTMRGENAGRQVRGGAGLDRKVHFASCLAPAPTAGSTEEISCVSVLRMTFSQAR